MAKLLVAICCILFLVSLVHGAKKLKWERETDASDVRPPVRSANILGGIDKTLVMWGGFNECFDNTIPGCDNIYPTDTWEYDTHDDEWTQIFPTVSPPVRVFMAYDNWEKEEMVLLYGGLRYNTHLTDFQFYGDLWAYSPATNTWSLRAQNNAGPGVRMAAGIAVEKSTMYLFGGLGGNFQSHNDLWSFDLITGLWTLISPDTNDLSVPDDRYQPTFEINRPKGDTIFLHGGNFSPAGSGEQRQDSWAYDIESNTWTDITADFPGRIHNAACARNKEFILAFGDVNDDEHECRVNQLSGGQLPVDDVFRYTANKDTWEELNVSGGPGPLKRVSSTTIGNKFYVWGGFDFICDENQLNGFPVYNRDLYSFKL
jgi:N-acetylneuraminic acid mutarotase